MGHGRDAHATQMFYFQAVSGNAYPEAMPPSSCWQNQQHSLLFPISRIGE